MTKGPFIATQLHSTRRRVASLQTPSPTQLNCRRRSAMQLTQLNSVQPISVKQVSRVELRRRHYRDFADATQLNVEQSWVVSLQTGLNMSPTVNGSHKRDTPSLILQQASCSFLIISWTDDGTATDMNVKGSRQSRCTTQTHGAWLKHWHRIATSAAVKSHKRLSASYNMICKYLTCSQKNWEIAGLVYHTASETK